MENSISATSFGWFSVFFPLLLFCLQPIMDCGRVYFRGKKLFRCTQMRQMIHSKANEQMKGKWKIAIIKCTKNMFFSYFFFLSFFCSVTNCIFLYF